MRDLWLNIQPLYCFLFYFFFQSKFPIILRVKSGFSSQAQTIFMYPQLGKGGDQMAEMSLGTSEVLPADLGLGTIKLLLLYPSKIMDRKNIKIPGNFQEEFTTSVSLMLQSQTPLVETLHVRPILLSIFEFACISRLLSNFECLVSLEIRCCSLLSWVNTKQCSCIFMHTASYI